MKRHHQTLSVKPFWGLFRNGFVNICLWRSFRKATINIHDNANNRGFRFGFVVFGRVHAAISAVAPVRIPQLGAVYDVAFDRVKHVARESVGGRECNRTICNSKGKRILGLASGNDSHKANLIVMGFTHAGESRICPHLAPGGNQIHFRITASAHFMGPVKLEGNRTIQESGPLRQFN